MSYHGIGAGPGPVETYYVDLPFPWGENTALSLPVRQMSKDVIRSITTADTAALVPWDSINIRVQTSLPVWIEDAAALAEPHVDRFVNKALLKFAGITAVLLGGAFYAAKKMSR